MAKRKRKRKKRKFSSRPACAGPHADRSQAAKVAAKRKKQRPLVAEELDTLRAILKKRQGAKWEISNERLALRLWGPIPTHHGKRKLTEHEIETEHKRRMRRIRKRVRSLRMAGYPICLAYPGGGGYFWGETPDEVRATSELFDERADTSHQIAARLVGMSLLDYQADRAAAKIELQEEAEKRLQAMQRLVDRLTGNPVTRTVFVEVVGDRMTGEEREKLAQAQAELEAERAKVEEMKTALAEHLKPLLALIGEGGAA